jgi:hypothetical protein
MQRLLPLPNLVRLLLILMNLLISLILKRLRNRGTHVMVLVPPLIPLLPLLLLPLFGLYPLPPPIPESLLTSQAESSQSQSSFGSNDSLYTRATECTRDKRLRIKTALLFRIPHAEIKQTLDVTDYQIWRAKNHRLTPQKQRRVVKLHTLEQTILKNWLLASPSHRHVPYKHIPHYLPELSAGEKAIRTAYKATGYCRRVARKKGFSEDPDVCRQQREFAEDGITWSRERV